IPLSTKKHASLVNASLDLQVHNPASSPYSHSSAKFSSTSCTSAGRNLHYVELLSLRRLANLSAAEGADPLTPLVSGDSGVVVHDRAVGQIQAQVGWEKIGLSSESPPSAGRFQINLAS